MKIEGVLFDYELIFQEPRVQSCNRKRVVLDNRVHTFTARNFDEATAAAAAFLGENAVACNGRMHPREFVQLRQLSVVIPTKRLDALPRGRPEAP